MSVATPAATHITVIDPNEAHIVYINNDTGEQVTQTLAEMGFYGELDPRIHAIVGFIAEDVEFTLDDLSHVHLTYVSVAGYEHEYRTLYDFAARNRNYALFLDAQRRGAALKLGAAYIK